VLGVEREHFNLIRTGPTYQTKKQKNQQDVTTEDRWGKGRGVASDDLGTQGVE